MKQLLIIFILINGLLSCNKNQVNVVNTIIKIDVYKTPEENEELGYDLISYNYRDKLKERFPSIDPRNITYQVFRQSTNDEVSLRLILSNTALAFSKELIAFFDTMANQKLEEHKLHAETIQNAVKISNTCFRLIDSKKIDSLWNLTSTEMKSLITKEDFNKMLDQRDSLFRNMGERKISTKQYYNSSQSSERKLSGDLYVLNYKYNNGSVEQITLQGDRLKLAGYRFYPAK